MEALAAEIGRRLKARGETLAVAESSAGGLVSAALVAVPGCSAFYLGGGVIYTKVARETLAGIPREDVKGMRSATEAYAALLARRTRERLGATWGLAETGASGPTGNAYGDPPGHSVVAVSGPVERTLVVSTGSADRAANMHAFAKAALALLESCLGR